MKDSKPSAPAFEALAQQPEDSNPPVYPEVSRDIYSIPPQGQPQPAPLVRRSSRETLPVVYQHGHQGFFQEQDTRHALPVAILCVPTAINSLPEDEKYKLKGLYIGEINRRAFIGAGDYNYRSNMCGIDTIQIRQAFIQLHYVVGLERSKLTRVTQQDTNFVLFFADYSSRDFGLEHVRNIQSSFTDSHLHKINYDHSTVTFDPCTLDALKNEWVQLAQKTKEIHKIHGNTLPPAVLVAATNHVLKNSIKVAEIVEAAPVINAPAPAAPKGILDSIKDVFGMKK